jgi:hypothetical protein
MLAEHTGEMINAYKIVVRKLEVKRPLEKHWHRLEGNIKMDLTEIGGLWTEFMWLRTATSEWLLITQ